MMCNANFTKKASSENLVLAGRAKGMMAERLAVSEAKLMKLHHDEVIQNLVEIKMELAQSRFEALELQVTTLSCSGSVCSNPIVKLLQRKPTTRQRVVFRAWM